MNDISPAMRTAMIASYACGPIYYQTDHVSTVECGAPFDICWSAVESCGKQGLMVLANNRLEAGRAISAELTPRGIAAVEAILAPARARRIRNGAGMAAVEPALSAVSRA